MTKYELAVTFVKNELTAQGLRRSLFRSRAIGHAAEAIMKYTTYRQLQQWVKAQKEKKA